MSGSVTGLTGAGLTLQMSGGESLAISGNGPFTFPTAIVAGTAFNIAVAAQPTNPAQVCTVAGGAGTIGANVTNVAVMCATTTHTLGGTVSGLIGTGLSIASGTGESLAITGNGDVVFPTALADGAAYNVIITSQPTGPAQTCTLINGTGTITANVTNIAIACTTNTYRVSATVGGLSGTGLVLQLNGGDDLAIAGNGTAAFTTSLIDGEAFTVSVSAQPSGPLQTCVVAGGAGTIAANDVNVAVTCTVNRYSVGGTASGLVGRHMVLYNGTEQLTVDSNGSFTFPTRLDVGASYDITIDHSPGVPAQRCAVANGVGTMGTANVTNVSVTCDAPTYSTFMLAANYADDTLSVLAIQDGNLRTLEPVPTGDVPVDVAIYKTTGAARYAYVANRDSDNVSAFAYDARTGRLQQVAGSPFSSGDGPHKLTLHPTRPFLYVSNSLAHTVRAFTIDEATGELTDRGSIALTTSDPRVLIEPAGRYAYFLSDLGTTAAIRTYSINQTTGALTEVSSSVQTVSERSGGMTFDVKARHLYLFTPDTNTIHAYALDAATGRPQPLSGSPFTTGGSHLRFLTLHPGGRFIYAAPTSNYNLDEGVTVFAIAPTGVPSRVPGSPFGSGVEPAQAAVDPTGRYLYVSEFDGGNFMHKYGIDTATGALSAPVMKAVPNSTSSQPPLFDSSGERLYQMNDSAMLTYAIDADTGELSASNWNVTHVGRGATVAAAVDDDAAPLEFVSNTIVSTSLADDRVYSTRLSGPGMMTNIFNSAVTNPRGVTIDPSGRFAYVARSSTLTAYSIDPANAILTNLGPFIPGTSPTPIAFSPAGRSGYAAIFGSTSLLVHAMNTSTGDVDSTALLTLQAAADELMVTPNGRRLYVRSTADGSANESRLWMYPIDAATGAVDPGGLYTSTNGPVEGMVMHPSGHYFYAVNTTANQLQSYFVLTAFDSIIPLNADLPFVADGNTPLAIDARGRFLFAVTAAGRVKTFRIGEDGRLTDLGDRAPFVVRATAIAADYSGDYLVIVDADDGSIKMCRIADGGSLIVTSVLPAIMNSNEHAVSVSGRVR